MFQHDVKFLDESTITGQGHECIPGTKSDSHFKSPQRLHVWLLFLFLLVIHHRLICVQSVGFSWDDSPSSRDHPTVLLIDSETGK